MAERDETGLLSALAVSRRSVGLKQVRRAVLEGRAERVYLACDADPSVTEPVAALCRERGVPVETGFTLHQLGKACGIAVGAAAAAVVE